MSEPSGIAKTRCPDSLPRSWRWQGPISTVDGVDEVVRQLATGGCLFFVLSPTSPKAMPSVCSGLLKFVLGVQSSDLVVTSQSV